jgi:hypothetical protein
VKSNGWCAAAMARTGAECSSMSDAATVEAEDELVEVGLQVVAAQLVDA